ncbi:MAG: CinA family protein [Hyphomicrobiaceae bacterium]|nr:CinA family protein [Hyphomicrobiaceae bacterium]
MFSSALSHDAAALVAELDRRGLMLSTAESCTGGLVAALLTSVPGSSSVVDRGFVTYSNEAKAQMLGVPMALIETHGAVSAEVARAMAESAQQRSISDLAISITGIAGPGGGSTEKPVGLVHFACARLERATLSLERRYGDIGREQIRMAAVADALALIHMQLETN